MKNWVCSLNFCIRNPVQKPGCAIVPNSGVAKGFEEIWTPLLRFRQIKVFLILSAPLTPPPLEFLVQTRPPYLPNTRLDGYATGSEFSGNVRYTLERIEWIPIRINSHREDRKWFPVKSISNQCHLHRPLCWERERFSEKWIALLRCCGSFKSFWICRNNVTLR